MNTRVLREDFAPKPGDRKPRELHVRGKNLNGAPGAASSDFSARFRADIDAFGYHPGAFVNALTKVEAPPAGDRGKRPGKRCFRCYDGADRAVCGGNCRRTLSGRQDWQHE